VGRERTAEHNLVTSPFPTLSIRASGFTELNNYNKCAIRKTQLKIVLTGNATEGYSALYMVRYAACRTRRNAMVAYLKKNFVFHATQEIINRSTCNPENCIIRNAAAAGLPADKASNIRVENGRLEFDVIKDGIVIEHRCYPLSNTIAIIAAGFDAIIDAKRDPRTEFTPFSFQVSNPLVTKPKLPRAKTVRVRSYKRTAPGEGESESVSRHSRAATESARQRKNAARALSALREQHGVSARYFGTGVL
jgi:hypothetical protein